MVLTGGAYRWSRKVDSTSGAYRWILQVEPIADQLRLTL